MWKTSKHGREGEWVTETHLVHLSLSLKSAGSTPGRHRWRQTHKPTEAQRWEPLAELLSPRRSAERSLRKGGSGGGAAAFVNTGWVQGPRGVQWGSGARQAWVGVPDLPVSAGV